MGALEDALLYWNVEMVEGTFIPSFLRVKLPGQPIAICPDPAFSEGLAAGYNSGIYYYNIDNQYSTLLVGTTDQKTPFRSSALGDQFLATFHTDGHLKLYNSETAEQVVGFQWHSNVQSVLHDTKQARLFCFLENNNEV